MHAMHWIVIVASRPILDWKEVRFVVLSCVCIDVWYVCVCVYVWYVRVHVWYVRVHVWYVRVYVGATD